MEPKIPTFAYILVGICGICAATSSSTSAVDCSTLVVGMADCLSFVSDGSTLKKPQGSCCAGVKTVIKADPNCICEAFQNSAQFGVALNLTKAINLPAACRISSPAIATCGANVAPGAAPAPSPMVSSPSAIPGAPTTGGGGDGGSEVSPSGAIGSSSAPTVSIFFGPLLLSMFAAISLYLT